MQKVIDVIFWDTVTLHYCTASHIDFQSSKYAVYNIRYIVVDMLHLMRLVLLTCARVTGCTWYSRLMGPSWLFRPGQCISLWIHREVGSWQLWHVVIIFQVDISIVSNNIRKRRLDHLIRKQLRFPERRCITRSWWTEINLVSILQQRQRLDFWPRTLQFSHGSNVQPSWRDVTGRTKVTARTLLLQISLVVDFGVLAQWVTTFYWRSFVKNVWGFLNVATSLSLLVVWLKAYTFGSIKKRKSFLTGTKIFVVCQWRTTWRHLVAWFTRSCRRQNRVASSTMLTCHSVQSQ